MTALILGALLGVLSGLLPGLHPNTLTMILEFLDTSSLILASIALVSFNLAFEIVPLHILSVADSDIGLAARLRPLILGMLAFCFLLPFFAFFPRIEMERWQILLLLILILLPSMETLESILIFLLSGFLGLIFLNPPLFDENILTAIFSGFFAFPSLLRGPGRKGSRLGNLRSRLFILLPFPLLFLVLPAITSAHILSFLFFFSQAELSFAVGFLRASSELLSFVALRNFKKARSGVCALLMERGAKIELFHIFLAQFLFLIAVLLSIKLLSSLRIKIEPKYMLVILLVLLTLSSGVKGIAAFFFSSLLSLLCERFEVRKSVLMGTLIVPTFLFYV